MNTVQMFGGPFDGGKVLASDFTEPIIVCYYDKTTGRMAIYHKQENGDYKWEKNVHESELQEVKK